MRPRPARPSPLPVVATALLCFTLMWNARGAFSLLYTALQREFGWGAGLSTAGYALSWGLTALFAPLLGPLVDRLGTRRGLLAGMACLALLYAGLSAVRSLWQYILTFGALLALAQVLVGISATALLSRRFSHNRGLAMGTMAIGYSLGPLFLFPAIGWGLQALGWRPTLLLLALPPLAVVPLVLRSGEAPPLPVRPVGSGGGEGRAVSLGEAVRTLAFWSLGGLYILGVVAYNILLVHQVARAEQLGFSPSLTTTAITVSFGASALGSVAGGWLSDRMGREVVWVWGSLLAVAGVGLLALGSPGAGAGLLWAYGLLLGLGAGVRLPMFGTMAADLYSGPTFGRLYGALQVLGALGGAVAPLAAGFFYQATGSYREPLLFAALAYLASGLLVFGVRPGRAHRRG